MGNVRYSGMEVLARWCSTMPVAKQLQVENTLKRHVARQSLAGLRLDTSWGRKLQVWARSHQQSERFSTVEDFIGLLMPPLELLKGLRFCQSPMQVVRLWAEAANLATTIL